jgi:hypothetical protein
VFENVKDHRDDIQRTTKQIRAAFDCDVSYTSLKISIPFFRHAIEIEQTIDQLVGEAAVHAHFLSPEMANLYFGLANTYKQNDLVETKIYEIVQFADKAAEEGVPSSKRKEARATIVDLPSFRDEDDRLLVLDAVLDLIWKNAREEWNARQERSDVGEMGNEETRVPTFLIVDEAHNLMSAKCEGTLAKNVRNHFRRIAAEGRKYDLSLVICTQRPDKIDRFVVSECENIAIMKHGSRSVLNKTRERFGLEDVTETLLNTCLKFGKGYAFLFGEWAKSSQPHLLLLRGGMRRTEVGSKDLPERWATPTPEILRLIEPR